MRLRRRVKADRFIWGWARSAHQQRVKWLQSMNTDLRLEIWLARKVCSPNLQGIFDGVTIPEERCNRMREAIAVQGIADASAGGIKRGTPKSFRECFEHVYGEPL